MPRTTTGHARLTRRHLLQMSAARGESVEVLDHLGMVYNNLGRLMRKRHPASRSAEGYYRKSVEIFQLLYPDLSEDVNLADRLGMAHSNLGNALLAQGKRDAARQSYRRALELYQQLAAEHPNNCHIARRVRQATELMGVEGGSPTLRSGSP